MLLIDNVMQVNKVAEIMREYPQKIWIFFRYWHGIGYHLAGHKYIRVIGIVEKRQRKGIIQ